MASAWSPPKQYPAPYPPPQPSDYRENGHSSSHLPPLRSYAEARTGMQPHYAALPMGAQPYAPAPPQYTYQNGPMQPMPMPSNGNGAIMRYPIAQAPTDARQVGVRGKKEIKRRTKSGCLTCRKRRIKCDESQPYCRNCAKSKRECLGYDPIFKPQSVPAPIQPAPAVSSAVTPITTSAKLPITPPHPPPPSLPAYPYGSTHNYPTGNGAYIPTQAYEGGYASVDPALGRGDHEEVMSHHNYHANLPPERRVRMFKMDDLFSLNDIPPRYETRETNSLSSPDMRREVAEFYAFHYAPGLDALLETDWYTQHGISVLQSHPELHDFVADCTRQFRANTDNPSMTNQIRSVEARLVWQLAKMPRLSSGPMDVARSEVATRVNLLENLLTGQFHDPHSILAPPNPNQDDVQHSRTLFWHHLSLFAAARDDHRDPAVHRQINDSLAVMRCILSMLENRDVMYSLAIGRYIGGQMPHYYPLERQVIGPLPDAQDETKLKVAVDFVQQEDQKGTTQVIQRVCSMALRSWALQKQ